MKTQFTLWQKVANTPPIALLVLFVWLLAPSNISADVTAEWGAYGETPREFPTAKDEVNGITITPNVSVENLYVGGKNAKIFRFADGKYFNITLSSGVIKYIGVYVWTQNTDVLKLQFCSEADYDDSDPKYLLGDPIVFNASEQGNTTLQEVTSASIPTGAKSARFYREGGDQYHNNMHRLIVTAGPECASPLTASFTAGGSGNPTGSAPANISVCEGTTFTLPDAGSLTWTGFVFTGWKLNNTGDLIAAGTSYTMPAYNITFTAQWEVAPVVAEWGNFGNSTHNFPELGEASTIDGDVNITLSANFAPEGLTLGGKTCSAYQINNTSNHIDIALSSGKFSSIGAYVSAPDQIIKVRFYDSEDNPIEGVVSLSSKYDNTNTTLREITSFPNNARSARLYLAEDNWQSYVYYIRVAAKAEGHTVTFASNDNSYGTVDVSSISAVPDASTVSISGNVLTLKETDVTATTAAETDEYTYAFSGWSVNNGDEITEDQTITANFTQTAKEYTLVWNTNGGSDLAGDPTSGTVAYGTTLTMPTDPTLNNYAFDGWKTAKDGTGTAAGLTMPAANTTYYAAWKQTLTLNTGLQGSGADKTDAYVYLNGAEVNNFTAHTVDGYTLKGYYTATSAGTKVLNEDGTFAATNVADYIAEGKWIRTNATTLYAVWKRNKTVAEWGSYETATYSFALGESGTGIVLNIPSGIDVGSYYLSGNNRNACRFDENEYVDISITTGRIASVSAYVYTKGANDKFYIQFCSETDYDIENLIGDPIEWRGENTTTPTLLTAIPSQTNAKSARIYKTGHSDANNFLYRLIVTASPECVNSLTASFELGEGASGIVPESIYACEDDDIVLPSIGSALKPFCTFNGWSDGINLYDAGDIYSMPDNDVTFTAQWTEDNTTKRIPETPSLYYANVDGGSTDTKDFNNETCVYLETTKHVEWNAYINPGYYDISMMYGAPEYGIRGTFSIIDPEGIEETRVFHTQPDATNNENPIYKNIEKSKVDLTGLTRGKVYTIKVEHNWSGSKLSIGHINFAACAPKEIPDETHFNKDNAFSAVTTATDMDIDGEAGNDELINLDRKYVEWDVKVTPGVYNVSLVYGAPQYSIKVSVALIDPENPASVIDLSKEGNNTYYYKSGSQNTPHHYTSTTRCDLTGIDGNKIYRLRISDEYGNSNYLRVKDLTFTPVAPIAISNVTDTRLDATNTILPPTMATDLDIDDDSNVDNLMNLYNTNAEWQVTLNKGLYNVQLVYGAPGYSIEVAVRLIDPAGEEPDKVLSIEDNKDYYYKSNPATTEEAKATTPHHYTSATKCALLDVTEDKIYKVRVADVYPKCNLRVSHVLFTPIAPVEIHEEATLNASNIMVAPSIVDSRIDIRNQQEAVWYATIDPHKFDITLTYFAEGGGTKVRFAIIPVGGDTIFVHQENKHDASNTTYTIPALDQDLTNISSGVYKIIVKDNYKSNGSKPQIISLTFSRAITTHTRSGLNVGDYGTICLPYAIEAANINGAEIYKLIEWPAGSCAVTLEQVENMEAGHPYIYQATANTATWRYNAEGDPTDATSENGLIGSYTKELISPNANNYIIYNNKLYYVDSEAYVGANRAYINRTEAENAPTPGPANGRKRIQMAVNGAQVLTGIDQLNDQMTNTKYMENGILYILRDGKLYNAQGQLVK